MVPFVFVALSAIRSVPTFSSTAGDKFEIAIMQSFKSFFHVVVFEIKSVCVPIYLRVCFSTFVKSLTEDFSAQANSSTNYNSLQFAKIDFYLSSSSECVGSTDMQCEVTEELILDGFRSFPRSVVQIKLHL